MNLLDFLKQLDVEIRDGEAHLAHLRIIGSERDLQKATEDDISSLKRQYRQAELHGYFLVTGTAVPDHQQPESARLVRERMNERIANARV